MLRDAYPYSDYIKNYNAKEVEFDSLAKAFQ